MMHGLLKHRLERSGSLPQPASPAAGCFKQTTVHTPSTSCWNVFSFHLMPTMHMLRLLPGLDLCFFSLAGLPFVMAAAVQTPFFMTLIQTNTGSIFVGPGIWMTCMGVITILSCAVMLKTHPVANK